MLPSSIKQFPFSMGLQEGIDPKQSPPGTLTRAVNVFWDKTGLLEKRPGMKPIGIPVVTTGGSTGNGRCFVRNGELCVIDGNVVQSLNSMTGTWSVIGEVPDVGLTQTPLLDPFSGIMTSDTAVNGDFAVTAIVPGDPTSVANSGFSICVTSISTGALLLPLRVVVAPVTAIVRSVRVIIIGTIAVFVASGVDANIRAWTLDLTTMVLSGASGLRADRSVANSGNWDARLVTGTSTFVLVYWTGAVIRLTTYDTAFNVVATSTQADTAPTKIAVDATAGESVCVGYFTNGTNLVRGYIANIATMVTSAGPTTVDATADFVTQIGVCRYDATTFAFAYTSNPVVGATFIAKTNSKMFTNAAALVANSRRATAGILLTSNPFMVNGKCYAFAVNAAGAGSAAAVALAAPFTGYSSILIKIFPDVDDGTSAGTDLTHPYSANVDILLGAFAFMSSAPLPVFMPLSGTKNAGSIPFVGTAPNNQNTIRVALRLVTVTAGMEVPLDLWRPVSHGAETFISGSVFSVYDGGDVFDYLFNYAPSIISQATAGAGGAIQAGTYIYATYPEYRGASGLIYRGPTVVGPGLVTAGATSANTLRFGNFNVGNKKHLQVERFATSLPVFRTVANGVVPQRLTEEPSFNLSPCTYSASSLVFVDTRNDTAIDTSSTPPTLASRPALYTGGGVLDDRQPPANVTAFIHKSRLWALAGNYKEWWYSKSFQDDIGTAPGFHQNLRILFDEPQVCGASMDEKIIFFSVNNISYLLGEGPGPNGQNSDYGTPSKVQTDTGCINPRSTISMQDGVMFQGVANGIYILNRDLTIEWIGRNVQDRIDQFPNITSAVQLPERNEVRFTCNNLARTLGIVLVYNYYQKQWTEFQYTLAGNVMPAIQDATVYQGKYTLYPTFGVFQEDATTNLDNGAWVSMDVEGAEVFAEGPLSYQRVRRVYIRGDLLSDCDVTMSITNGGKDTYDQVRTWTANELAALGNAKIGIHVRKQASDSIRFRITDGPPSSPGVGIGLGKGVNLSAIGFEIAPQPGIDRRGAIARK